MTVDEDGSRTFINDHIANVENILERIKEVDMTLSVDKSKNGVGEIVVVGHLCGLYGQKPNFGKVDAIGRMKVCISITEVRR